ncbi:hypothetical protein [Motilimonas pumila]|uniref:DUF3316 domain-containing protein n=1 Tax=Motilimonas pumila TaxID=2303987 RepID=A0A418YJ80_9GAMM|nr:hypothetical protein [Motilimonas pumila]RJG50705.1 hypothetical protein D1Z90_04310 [Motilimonas pumila]
MSYVTALFCGLILLAFAGPQSVHAEPVYPTDMSFDAAISQSIIDAKSSGYKEIVVSTTAGAFRGEYVQQTSEVLVLKQHTGNTHLKSGKEKLQLSYIRLDSIVAVSAYTLE